MEGGGEKEEVVVERWWGRGGELLWKVVRRKGWRGSLRRLCG